MVTIRQDSEVQGLNNSCGSNPPALYILTAWPAHCYIFWPLGLFTVIYSDHLAHPLLYILTVWPAHCYVFWPLDPPTDQQTCRPGNKECLHLFTKLDFFPCLLFSVIRAQSSPFHTQWWFLVIVALSGAIVILLIITLLCCLQKRRKKESKCYFYYL